MNAFAPITPRAFDAIIAQLARKADEDRFAYATINGKHVEFTAFYSREFPPGAGMNSRHEWCDVTEHRVIGAWMEDGDTGEVWAGDRAELVALVGEEQVEAMQWTE